MTTQDQVCKWLCYALGVFPVWLAETQILNRIPLFGVIPVLLPLAAVAVALWEGASAARSSGCAWGWWPTRSTPVCPAG